MKKHVAAYLKAHNFKPGDYVGCEAPGCRNPAVDVHHVLLKGMGGSKYRDVPGNLRALCREHHQQAHGIVTARQKGRL